MEANLSLMFSSGSGEGDSQGGQSSSRSLRIFVPLLLILIILTLSFNSILLLLIARSWRLRTSLNIILLGLNLLHLLTSFNQAILLISVIRDAWVMGKGMCHLVAFMQVFYSWATTLTHLLISRDRYQVSKDPFSWRDNRKKAILLSITLWVVVGVTEVTDRVLHLSDFDHGATVDYTVCYWAPTTLDCTNILYCSMLQLLSFPVFLLLSATIYYNYYRVSKVLRGNEKRKEHEAKLASVVLKGDKRKKTTSERALQSLVVIFTIHFLSQLPSHITNVTRHIQGLSKSNNAEPIHQIGLLALTCIGYLTALTPFILFFNHRFKQHVKDLLQCSDWGPQDHNTLAGKVIGNTSYIRKIQTHVLQTHEKPKPHDITIFYSKSSNKYSCEVSHEHGSRRWSTDVCKSASVEPPNIVTDLNRPWLPQLNSFFPSDSLEQAQQI